MNAARSHYVCCKFRVCRSCRQDREVFTVYGDGAEMVLEFTDGTSFTTSIECKSSLKANLIRTGIGTPEVIKSYSE